MLRLKISSSESDRWASHSIHLSHEVYPNMASRNSSRTRGVQIEGRLLIHFAHGVYLFLSYTNYHPKPSTQAETGKYSGIDTRSPY